MNSKLRAKVKESVMAVLPITLIVLFISTFLVPLNISSASMFFFASAPPIRALPLRCRCPVFPIWSFS